jgi:hypothetical protein
MSWPNYPNFPNFRPQGRKLIPGDFPNKKYKGIDGQEFRIMRGVRQTRDRLILTFRNQSDREVIQPYLLHHAAQASTFGSFRLPNPAGSAGIWAGMQMANSTTERYRTSKWRYSKALAPESIQPGISNLTIELVLVQGADTSGITSVFNRAVDQNAYSSLRISRPNYTGAKYQFPALRPNYRKMTAGEYNVKTFIGPDGSEVRALDGLKMDDKLDLRYTNISSADISWIIDHYTSVKGTWGEFYLPAAWNSTIGAGLELENLDYGEVYPWFLSNRWVYDRAPEVVYSYPGRGTVTVSLRCPHPEGRNRG